MDERREDGLRETEAGLRILFVEDLEEDCELASRIVEKAGLAFERRRVDTREDFLAALEEFRPDVVVSDFSMPGFDGMSALRLSLERDPLLPFIMLTGALNEDTAVACMKAGAMDYLIKGQASRLPYAIREALERGRLARERLRMDAALRESEQNLRNLADSGTALIWTSGTDGLCNYFNRTWLEFTGRSLEAELGNGWAEGVHPEDLEACVDTYTANFARRERFSMEYRLKRRDGEYRWIQDDGCPRFDAGGTFLGYIGHCLDVTDRKLAEEKVAKALAEKETLMREILHRTRNNMQVIMALLSFEEDLARDDAVSEVVRKTNDRIMAMSLAHQGLYESRDLSRIDLGDYAAKLAQLLREHETVQGGIVSLRLELSPVPALIDAAVPFGLVFHELVTNAFRHAFPDGRAGEVLVRLGRDGEGAIELEVSDTGVGLPADFEGRSARGVGLQMVRGLVEQQLRGRLEFRRERGLSCRVSFRDSQFTKRV